MNWRKHSGCSSFLFERSSRAGGRSSPPTTGSDRGSRCRSAAHHAPRVAFCRSGFWRWRPWPHSVCPPRRSKGAFAEHTRCRSRWSLLHCESLDLEALVLGACFTLRIPGDDSLCLWAGRCRASLCGTASRQPTNPTEPSWCILSDVRTSTPPILDLLRTLSAPIFLSHFDSHWFFAQLSRPGSSSCLFHH